MLLLAPPTAALLLLARTPPPPARQSPSCMMIEPAQAWSEWTLRDVGIFDSAILALAAGGIYYSSAFSGGREPEDTASSAAAVLAAERAVAESVANSPCNGPSIELLEALEAADLEAARSKRVAPVSRDPNELPSAFELPWRKKTQAHQSDARMTAPTGRRSAAPKMSAPAEALSDIVVPHISDTDDERLWVPQTECLSFRPLCLCVSQGYYVNLLRFQGGGTLGCHRHSSPVHAHTIKGSWGYKEHAWQAQAGTYVFEPPGETHTLVVGGEEMIALFHVTGALLYCDPDNPEVVTGFDDVFTKLEKAKKHYEAVGLGAEFVEQFVR